MAEMSAIALTNAVFGRSGERSYVLVSIGANGGNKMPAVTNSRPKPASPLPTHERSLTPLGAAADMALPS
jgi:hypothetical protein